MVLTVLSNFVALALDDNPMLDNLTSLLDNLMVFIGRLSYGAFATRQSLFAARQSTVLVARQSHFAD